MLRKVEMRTWLEKSKEYVILDCCVTIQEITHIVGISTRSMHSIITEDLCMLRVLPKFLPKVWAEQQKQHHKEIAQDTNLWPRLHEEHHH